MPALLHLGTTTTSGVLGFECLQPSLDVSGKLCISSSHISLFSSVQASRRTCERSTQTSDSGGIMLDGGSLAYHSSQHLGQCSLAVSYHKRSHHGCFGRPHAQGSVIPAFNPLAAERDVLHRQGFSFSVCQAVMAATWASMTKVYQQCWKEWAGWCAWEGAPNNAISAPKLAEFLVHLFKVGLACHMIGIYCSAISAFLEPHCLHKTSNHPVITKVMYHFYLQHPPSHKCFDPWDVEHLLSLLESWALASSLTTFKLAWKTATLFALVTAKCCSDFTFIMYWLSAPFSSASWFYFHSHVSGGKTDWPGHLPPQICIESHSNVNLCPVFYLKAYLRHTESVWEEAWWITCDLSFFGNNRQHRLVCAKTISSWVMKVLFVAKAA